ncbi:hypothetical protein WJX72_011588 [[Myrmecia] bisecta]|uniref:Uncharacterized protein n=1 Tax=[Myrmecia] bisecta TaxID=41462 RepID=A0AAW1QB75_9CHLO
MKDLFYKLQSKLQDAAGADEYFIDLSKETARKVLASVNISAAEVPFIDHVLMAREVQLIGTFKRSFDTKNVLALTVSGLLGFSGNLEIHCSRGTYQMNLSKREDGKAFPWAIKLFYQDYRRAEMKLQHSGFLARPSSEETASDGESSDEDEEDSEAPDIELEPDGTAQEYTPLTSEDPTRLN